MKYLIWDFHETLAYREEKWTATLADFLERESPLEAATADCLRSHLLSGFPWHTPDRYHLQLVSAG